MQKVDNIKFNVEQSLFHGIRNGFKLKAIDILKDILSTGYILTHEGYRKIKGEPHEREVYSHQGQNAISLCFHPSNIKLKDEFSRVGIPLNYNAFNAYVNQNMPSIILDSKLIDELKIRRFGGYPRTLDEIQVLDNIPLEYMQAIGYTDITPKFIEELQGIIEKDILLKDIDPEFYDIYYENNILKVLQKQHSEVERIKALLMLYNYNVPIINPVNGKVWEDFETHEEKIKKLFKK